MKVSRSKNLKQLSNEFSSLFPYLKISFYQSQHGDHQGSPKSAELDESTSLSELGVQHDEEFEVRNDITVTEFEQAMEEKFGLHVQVNRRSGDLWLQTISTDDWSLGRQNESGMQSVQS